MRVSDYHRNVVCLKSLVMAVALLVVACLGNVASAETLSTGLTTYLNFDENIGTTAHDRATSGSSTDNGAIVNADSGGGVTWIDGKFGSALQIVNSTLSSGNYVQFGSDASSYYDLNHPGSALTMSMWIKLAYLPTATSGNTAIWNSTTDTDSLYCDKANSELRTKVVTTNGNAARPGIAQTALSTTGWHHLLTTFDGTGTAGVAKIYWDGSLKDTHTGNDGGTGTGLTGSILATSQAYYLGHKPGLAGDCSFSVDDFAIWSRVLTSGEIATLASGASAVIPEPNTYILLVSGLFSLLCYAWRKRK